MEKILNYINGELCESVSGEWLENENPALGKVYSQITNSNSEDANKAIEAARNAFPTWSKTPTAKRVAIVRKIAKLIRENLEDLAKAESIDNGKPVSVASVVDIPRSATNLEFFADAISQFSDNAYHMDDTAINYTKRAPLGVVTTISPWNLPLYLFTWKIAPALVSGNTIVAKPSEVTPMTAFLFSKLCIQAGLPNGVLNILHGEGPRMGETLVTHTDVKAVSFTGSTATGRLISQMAAPHFKKVSLEMGGKNPTLIFEDANFDKAVSTASRAAFSNQGQICLCGSRIFVHESIYERFKEAMIGKINKLKQGNPLDPANHQGAMVSKAHFEKVMSYLEIAKKEGGKILTGGERLMAEGENENGYFIKPTLIENLDPYCQTNQDEIFGPVATITPFKDEDQALEFANSTRYGLGASVWTENVNRAHRVANKIDSGIVWVNTWMLRDLRTPFGGMKESGVGREGGFDALRFFTEPKNICIKVD